MSMMAARRNSGMVTASATVTTAPHAATASRSVNSPATSPSMPPPGTSLSAIPRIYCLSERRSARHLRTYLVVPIHVRVPRCGRWLRRVGRIGVAVIAPGLPGCLVEHDAEDRGANLVESLGGPVQVSSPGLTRRHEHQRGIGVPAQDRGVGDGQDWRAVD